MCEATDFWFITVNKAIVQMATNLLRSGPLSVRGHLVALAQIERGYRAFGLSGRRAPANAPGAGDPLHLSITGPHARPRPLDYHLIPSGACLLTLLTYPPGAGAAGSGSIPASLGPCVQQRPRPRATFLISDRCRSDPRAALLGIGLSVMTYAWRPFVPGCTGCMCNGRPQRTATGTAIRAMGNGVHER